MCNCMNEMGGKIKKHISQQIPAGGEIIDYETDWDNKMLSLEDGKYYVMLNYKLAYRAKKKSGEMAKNITRLSNCVKMSYCPFCGVKYD